MRPTPKRFIKVVFLVSTLFFVLLNVNFFLRDDNDDDTSSEDKERSALNKILWGEARNQSDSDPNRPGAFWEGLTGDRDSAIKPEETMERLNEGRYLFNISHFRTNRSERGGSDMSGASGDFVLPRNLNANLSEIRRVSWEANRRQSIRNLDKFDLGESTVVIVVQVHNRPEYLRYLVDSLRKAAEMEQAFLIFSHDYYSDELNDIVASVDFCLVLQIFYPYSMQLHPREFPGEDPRDCPRNVNREQAMDMGCQNKEYPDKYGHYREAKYSQTKQHWFWKINHAFDYLDVTRNFNGPMLFIEEDHYLVEDFMSVLRMMYRLKTRACVDCSIITLGTYDKKPAYGSASPKVEIMNWVSSKHNMGMSMTREIWNKIKNCGEAFCRFDDYNWDWSLHYIGMTCIPTKLRVMVMKSPRIYHIGECGLHAKGKNCNPADRVEMISSLLASNRPSLFPPNLVVGGYPTVPRRVPKANGGWGDIRDHELCISSMNEQSHG